MKRTETLLHSSIAKHKWLPVTAFSLLSGVMLGLLPSVRAVAVAPQVAAVQAVPLTENQEARKMQAHSALPSQGVAQGAEGEAAATNLKGATEGHRLLSAAELLARVAADPQLEEERNALILRARKHAKKPLVKRPNTVAEAAALNAMKYPKQPNHMRLLAPEQWEQVALSLADARIADGLSRRLPMIAAAGVLTGDPTLFDYVCAQLEEVATWDRLQRPGWSLTNSKLKLPPGGDGAWLGTGWAVRAIVDTVAVLPPQTLSPELLAALKARVGAEVEAVVEDWEHKRSWFIANESVYSNQWVLPSEALVLGSLFAGVDRYRDAYELGVQNLLRCLDAQGERGEYVEGVMYSSLTLHSILSVADEMARAGDYRLLEHPFVQHYPEWLVQHLQPGRPGHFMVNAFDSSQSMLGQDLLWRLIAVTGSQEALWVVRNYYESKLPQNLADLLSRAAQTGQPQEPELFAVYPMAARVNWRSSWEDATASGFWLRGGHESDAHDHQDRGHVNFTIRGKPVLIEAGLFSYGVPEHDVYFRGVPGHNVLQVGDATVDTLTVAQLRKGAGQRLSPQFRSAPITVNRLDAQGGDVTTDLSLPYATVQNWERNAQWDSDVLTVTDTLELEAPDVVQLRWHLAEPVDAPQVQGEGYIRVGDVLIRYQASAAVTVQVEPMYDNTLRPNKREMGRHACVVIRSAEPVQTFSLKTIVSLAQAADG